MFKELMCMAMLGALVVPASAQTFWQFGYTGFLYSKTNQFDPEHTEGGFFAGSDTNGNGLLEQAELTRFAWQQVLYVDVNNRWQECMMMECSLDGFRYDLRSGQLDFTSEWSYHDEMAYSTSTTIIGDRVYFYGSVGGGEGGSYTWLWTDQTRFNISPAPVPEPGQSPMLLAGLGVLGLTARRRRRGRPGGIQSHSACT